MATANGSSAALEEVEALRQQLESLQTTLRKKEAELETVAPYNRTYGRTMVATVLESDSQGLSLVGKTIRVGGWVKTGREAGAGAFAFLEVNDGSCFQNIQVMVEKAVAEEVGGLKSLTPTSTCVLIEGVLAETPEGTKQKVELKATKVVHLGSTDPAEYPLAKKKQSFEFLREKAHLRPRTNTIGAVARIRNALAYATHRFFQEQGFLYVHTPIVTASDCEGAGEMFQVTTLLSKVDEEPEVPPPSPEELAALRSQVAAQGEAVKAAKTAAAANKEDKEAAAKSKAEVGTLLKLKEQLTKAEEAARNAGGLPRTADGKVDYSKDFFSKPSYLTVSGQLNGEYYACALSNIYTFGPTFRAENSHTARHLAEFWMIEPEMAFCDLADDMQCAEDYVRFCCRHILDNCRPDLEFINGMIDKGAIARLEQVANSPFKRVSYTEAVELLEGVVASGEKKFEYPVSWGIDLQSEHERYLTEEIFKQPIIVYNYPKEIKAFYMRLNDDGKTVAAMDVLVPKVGELVGGSQREDRLDVLTQRIAESGMPMEPYAAYLDLRKYGTVPHSGFGLGFERLILFATGLDNIRDVIPFPRWPGNAAY
ncbi:asparagine-tRNA cytoplasmic 1-like [Micractinium conductrix]|uniref:asparagine--tRNA ligase n=1 Tax=Micractinium conductrix TaxID=554055 RepID=A0A2P6VG12_9CHLO|nr:asparagine-tRNA cytoplasmic 1-like [Micractinium conductrix]|eukprot:PSC73030.1 asparagine-tRNA cytoplasmic 1-like [Micractinium conductrix]